MNNILQRPCQSVFPQFWVKIHYFAFRITNEIHFQLEDTFEKSVNGQNIAKKQRPSDAHWLQRELGKARKSTMPGTPSGLLFKW